MAKKTTLTELKKQAKQGKKNTIQMLPSKIKPNTGWYHEWEEGKEFYYDKKKGEFYLDGEDYPCSLDYWLSIYKTYLCDEKTGKTIYYYIV